MSEAAPEIASRKLPLRRIMAGAFELPWRNRIGVARAVGLSMLFVVATFLGWHVAGSARSALLHWTLYLAGTLVFAWLAFVIHRLVLADSWNPQSSARFDWRRYAKFSGTLLLVWLLYNLVFWLVVLILSAVFYSRYVPVGETPVRQQINWPLLNLLAAIPASWLLGRLSLVLPAIAMDENSNLGVAWRLSRGNGLKLMIVAGILPWLLEALIDLLYRNGATAFEAALLGVLSGVFAVIEVTALSLSYYELTHASAPPPTHPPG